MTWGFAAVNRNNQILVSSQTRNLHFVGKATLDRTIRQYSGFGGLRHWAFRIACKVTPMPFFTQPSADYYGIAAVRKIDATTWEIEIIRSGTSTTIPEVYVFSDPSGATNFGTTKYGMQVIRDDGTPSFDSRLAPLAVTGGIAVQPTSNPLTTTPTGLSWEYCSSGMSDQFAPTTYNEYSVSAGESNSKPIFYYPSLAQAEREVSFSGNRCLQQGLYTYSCVVGFNSWSGTPIYGICGGYQCIRSLAGASTYWAFYRSGIRFVSGKMRCGWITCDANCHYAMRDTSLGGVIGFYNAPSSEVSTGGAWPYSNKTLNRTLTTVIIGNGARYD